MEGSQRARAVFDVLHPSMQAQGGSHQAGPQPLPALPPHADARPGWSAHAGRAGSRGGGGPAGPRLLGQPGHVAARPRGEPAALRCAVLCCTVSVLRCICSLVLLCPCVSGPCLLSSAACAASIGSPCAAAPHAYPHLLEHFSSPSPTDLLHPHPRPPARACTYLLTYLLTYFLTYLSPIVTQSPLPPAGLHLLPALPAHGLWARRAGQLPLPLPGRPG